MLNVVVVCTRQAEHDEPQTPSGRTDEATSRHLGRRPLLSDHLDSSGRSAHGALDRVHFVGGVLLPRSITRVIVLGAVAALSLSACANNGGGAGGGGGGGSTDLVISTDLPLQGASASTSESTNKMIELYLEQIGHKAGKYNITLKTYDDSTAAKGAWDDATCAKNATDHVANETRSPLWVPTTPAARRSRCPPSTRTAPVRCSWCRTPTPTRASPRSGTPGSPRSSTRPAPATTPAS